MQQSKKKETVAKEKVAVPVALSEPKQPPPVQQKGVDAGPRSSGVRRSSERARGKKRKDPTQGTGSFE